MTAIRSTSGPVAVVDQGFLPRLELTNRFGTVNHFPTNAQGHFLLSLPGDTKVVPDVWRH